MSLHIVTAVAVKVSIGSTAGNTVAQFLRRGDLVPEGIEQEQLNRLLDRDLIEVVEEVEVVEVVEAPVIEIPDGDPVEEWSSKQIEAWAARQTPPIDLPSSATTKAAKIEAITAARGAAVPAS